MSRLRSKTPKFFRIVRNIGVVLASVSGVILAAPIALPASIVTLAGVQTTTTNEPYIGGRPSDRG